MYCTAQQLLGRFDAVRLAQLAAPRDPAVTAELFALTINAGDRSEFEEEDVALADAALVRLNAAITRADRIIDSYIESRYTLPIDQVVIDASPLPTFCMDLAIYDLSGVSTTEDEERRRNEAISFLKDISAARASLGEQESTATSQNNYITRCTESKQVDWDTF